MTDTAHQYPTTFAESLVPVDIATLQDQAGQEAIQSLNALGYEVVMGLRREDVPGITAIAGQEGVREFCPNDLQKRFGDEPMAEKWHEKGRVFFQLRKLGETGLAGYGWTGPEKCEELPEAENTFAIRISEELAGQGLGTLFTTVIVSGSMALGMRNIGLETWESNRGAWRAYEKAGAVHVTGRADRRLTLREPDGPDGKVADRRLFMYFAQTMTKKLVEA